MVKPKVTPTPAAGIDEPIQPPDTGTPPATPDDGGTLLPTLPSGGGGTWTRSQLRAVLEMFGIPLPTDMTDLNEAAQKFQSLLDVAGKIPDLPLGMGGNIQGTLQDMLTRTGQQIAQYAAQIPSLWGDAALEPQSAYMYFQDFLRPPQPSVEKLPTAEEFLGDFNTAWESFMGGMKGLTLQEQEWASDNLKSLALNQYMARLGEFAKGGQSPFTLKEVTREQRGIAAGTPAGAALDAALGPGVKQFTAIEQELSATAPPKSTGAETASAQVQRQAAELRRGVAETGTGVPQEFIATPNVMPLDFLTQAFSPQSIKMLFAGSPTGAGRSQPAARQTASSPKLAGEVAP